ncbi:MAG TPA: SusE domain-containing protein [Hymenobacter sp.]|uniref:SusE domain-containing protein n=1 Tax=Hymenobacter sp. TaxID=1898978 RepID=UPI002D80A427|nr:SusE domain-containing protein [Hymenobacter sp.]HET9502693.1 SusE domain-containing protein [Hymenobacter sp.]
MKNWLTQGLGLCALVLLGLTSACNKEETRAVLTPGAAPTLKASTTTPDLALTTANKDAAAVTLTYSAADFGYSPAATYTLQFDKKGGNFASPITLPGGTVAGATPVTTAQLVNIFSSLGYPFNSASQVDVRVVASVSAAVAPAISPVVTLTGTPVPLCIANTNGDWGIVGTAVDGWPGNPLPATQPDRMLTYDCYTQTFTLRTTFTAGAFKLRANKAWSTSLGAATATYSYPAGVALSTSGGDLMITTPGTYTVTLTLTNNASGSLTGGTVTLKP